jgi:hypothetical protein
MKTKLFVVLAVVFSLIFSTPSIGSHNQPNVIAMDQHGGA